MEKEEKNLSIDWMKKSLSIEIQRNKKQLKDTIHSKFVIVVVIVFLFLFFLLLFRCSSVSDEQFSKIFSLMIMMFSL
jgi:hypothetical protein